MLTLHTFLDTTEELFLCTSVRPKVPGSTEEEWEGEEDVNSGEFDI